MIIILEGVNGVGKTTYAKALRAASTPPIPIYRAFREDDDVSWGSEEGAGRLETLRALGIPVNTHVEDMFLADVAATLPGINLILDRSLPSAIAYSAVLNAPGVRTGEQGKALLALWEARLKRAGAVLVHLSASYDTIRERAMGRSIPSRKDAAALERAIDGMIKRTRLPRLALKTDDLTVQAGVRRIKAVVDREEARRADAR